MKTRARHQYPQRQRGVRRPFRFYIVSLGCPKNTVDANGMAVLLQRAGYEATQDLAQADMVIVNTCGFIAQARQESLETLLELAEQLRPRQSLIAAGCWAQREPEALLAAVPALTAVIGTRSWPDIVALADTLSRALPLTSPTRVVSTPLILPEQVGAPGYVTSGASAYLKIADGCSRQCAFCAIPLMKGPSVSRAPEAILADARQLQAMGVLEINLIAQDITYYGYDLGMKEGLAQLLERLAQEVPHIPWLRLLYTFPGYVTERLIEVIAQTPQVLHYIDIPLQHAHPDVLRRMRRPADVDGVRRTLARVRERIPDVAIRTTLIVGFPGETDAEFQTLLDFVREMQFDRLGVFTYSHETGVAAAQWADDVLPEVKEARREALMLAQQEISATLNQRWVGRRLQVLLEGTGDGLTVGRSYRDAPEIDGLVLIPETLEPHCMVTVEITEATEYDLIGRLCEG